MRLFFLLLLLNHIAYGQKTFYAKSEVLSINLNDKLLINNWTLTPSLNPDILEVDCFKKTNKVVLYDQSDSIVFHIKKGQTIDFKIITPDKQTANTRIIGVIPNANFTQKYIDENKGRVIIAIPEVSELANILMVLNKDAEIDKNMFDTQTDYYKKVKAYFSPYTKHPMIDTIQKYISGLRDMEGAPYRMFSNEAYGYYYHFKMNACTYRFKGKNKIVNNGYIRDMGKGYSSVNPMKDLKLIADFAKKSNFRKFYADNKPYYDTLLATYRQLNPIDKMQKWLDKRFGFTYDNYSIYFSPLIWGAHSAKAFDEPNFKQTFMFVARADFDEKIPRTINELSESRVVFTEIDHNYVNPVSDKFIDRINPIFSNRAKWAAREITNQYNTPYKVFNEYMTFAVYSLYILDNYGEQNLYEFLPIMETQMQDGRGFSEFKAFNRALLAMYQKDKNVKIEQLYQQILDWTEKHN